MEKADNPINYKEIPLFARRYLDTYYQQVNQDEPPLVRFLIERCREFKEKIAALEIGCGPTVHHALPLAPYVRSIDMADYVPENLAVIDEWRANKEGAFSWSIYTKMILEEDGIDVTEKNIKDRENQLRMKIGNLRACDVLQTNPLGEPVQYPLVTSFYCAEEVGTSTKEWGMVMQNICSVVASNGHLLMAVLKETSHYVLENLDGSYEWLPCHFVSQDNLYKCLVKEGFKPNKIDLRSIETPTLVNMGIPGILLAAAEK